MAATILVSDGLAPEGLALLQTAAEVTADPKISAEALLAALPGYDALIVRSRTKVTAVCVTHDVDEAILLADRVVMMSNGPNATIGNIMEVNLPRPRSRKMLLSHPDYYAYREELLDFLEAYEGGANPPPALLEEIKRKRAERVAAGPRLRIQAAE